MGGGPVAAIASARRVAIAEPAQYPSTARTGRPVARSSSAQRLTHAANGLAPACLTWRKQASTGTPAAISAKPAAARPPGKSRQGTRSGPRSDSCRQFVSSINRPPVRVQDHRQCLVVDLPAGCLGETVDVPEDHVPAWYPERLDQLPTLLFMPGRAARADQVHHVVGA